MGMCLCLYPCIFRTSGNEVTCLPSLDARMVRQTLAHGHVSDSRRRDVSSSRRRGTSCKQNLQRCRAVSRVRQAVTHGTLQREISERPPRPQRGVTAFMSAHSKKIIHILPLVWIFLLGRGSMGAQGAGAGIFLDNVPQLIQGATAGLYLALAPRMDLPGNSKRETR